MGIFSSIFGDDKVKDGIYNGVDKAFLTDEERTDIYLKFLKAYEPFKIIQRYLALLVGIPYVIVHLISVIFLIRGLDTMAIKIAEFNNNALGDPFLWIMALYFAGGLAEGSIRAFKDKGK